MSMKKILMLSVMTALISPITVSSAIASKTMGQILLEQNQKQEAEKKAEEQKRIAEEQKAVATAKQEEHKQVLATGNVELEKKINTVIDGLNKSMGTHIGQAKADDIKSLEAAVDDILNQIPKVYQAGQADGAAAGHATGHAAGKDEGLKHGAAVLNQHLGQILPGHTFGNVDDTLTNLNAVLGAADGYIGKMPADVMTKNVKVTGAPITIANFVEKLKAAVKAADAALNAQGKGRLKNALTAQGLELVP